LSQSIYKIRGREQEDYSGVFNGILGYLPQKENVGDQDRAESCGGVEERRRGHWMRRAAQMKSERGKELF